MAERTGCGILCDVNNIYVSAHNHGWDARTYLAALPPAASAKSISRVIRCGRMPDGATLRIDDHGSRVIDEVWALYRGSADALRAGADPDRVGQRRAAARTCCSRRPRTPSLLTADAEHEAVMPTLLEVQRAMRRAWLQRRRSRQSAAFLADPAVKPDRLNIYRNTLLLRPDQGAAALLSRRAAPRRRASSLKARRSSS